MSASQNKNRFKEAVANTPEVAGAWQPGVSALGADSVKVVVPDPLKYDGSLDIDFTTRGIYPQDHRWDYAISYNGEVFYLEVHSAITSQVSVVLDKLKWLKQWLATSAPEIKKLTSKTKHPYYWIQSSKCDIPKHMPQYKRAVQHNLLPIALWDYSRIPSVK